jgi:hypothetical protein
LLSHGSIRKQTDYGWLVGTTSVLLGLFLPTYLQVVEQATAL